MRRWLRSRVLLSRVGTRCRPVSRSTPKPRGRETVRQPVRTGGVVRPRDPLPFDTFARCLTVARAATLARIHTHTHTSARTRTRKRMNGRARDVTTPDHRSAPSSSVNRVSGHRRLLYSDSNERRPTAEEASARPSSAQQLSLPPPPPPSPAPRTGNVYFPPQPTN
ncbi:Uncharacterized protein FWK35_00000901 [Aphis craccivora]|uniref:Uncharacterized protein n=1 Tax=Aphis craccivora TaxID=307492 RepID=A0A6G0ZN25_APHCR|nr:Uncharacterized protein FWK35_00000901 [Aphis craccivora]